MALKKIGIMGGTFDPIHVGHLIMAEAAYENFELDKVLIMPSGNPPHKKNEVCATTRQRVAMTRLAIENNNHFELSLIEVERKGFTYTYETLEELKKNYSNAEIYFIMGADSLFSFEKWKNPEIICQNSIILVAVRYNLSSQEMDAQIKFLSEKYNADIRKLNTPNIDISSKMIRTKVAMKKTIKYFVPNDVENYIYINGLYKKI